MLKNLRYLFSVLLLAVFSVNAWASVVTFNFTGTNEYGSGVAPSTASDYISISFAQGDVTIDATGARYWYNAKGNTLRLYSAQASTLTVSVPSGYVITEISATTLNFGTVSAGSISGTTWTGSANSVTFSDCGGNLQFKEIVVTYQEAGGDTPPVVTVNPPTFSVASGEVLAGTEVTVTADEGCVIEYSINGEDAVTSTTNEVTLTVDENMTITAVAHDVTGAPSDEVSATYTVVTPLTIAELKALTAGESAWLSLDGVQVLAVFAKDIYIKDATGAIDIYNVALEVSEGDILSGVVKATYSVYKNQPEITAIVGDVTVTGNETVEPVVITPAEVADHMMELVKFENANVKDGWILDEAGDIQIYDKTGEITIYDGTFNVTGIAILFGDKWEVCPRRGADLEIVETSVAVQVSSAEKATYYNAEKAIVVPANVDVYTVKIDAVNGKVVRSKTYAEGDVIPAGEGVIVEAAEGVYDFAIGDGTNVEKDADNLLRGETDVNGYTYVEGNYLYYLLARNGETLGFYWGAENGAAFLNNAPHAYLAVPVEQANGAKSFVFGEATGIKTIDNGQLTIDGAVYNLNGQRVNPTQRGIYIVNGKKVIVK